MKLILPFLLTTILLSTTIFGQTVILDFEEAATTTQFQFFGGSNDGTLGEVIANPNPTGINTSATVFEFIKPGDGQTGAGGSTNPDPMTEMSFTSGDTKICVDVHMDHIGNLALKMEGSNLAPDWILTQVNTVMNDWETLCFDVSEPSEEEPNETATGRSYPTLSLFFDFGTAGTGTDVVSYVDNVITTDGTVSAKDLNRVENLFELTPTLVKEQALITFSNTTGGADYNVTVISTVGNIVDRQTVGGTIPSIELQAGDLATGLYFVQVQQGNNVEVIRFMVY